MLYNNLVDGVMAQLVERLVRNEEASGSNPLSSTIKCGQKRSIRLNPRKILGFSHFKGRNFKTHFHRCKTAVLRYLTESNPRFCKKLKNLSA